MIDYYLTRTHAARRDDEPRTTNDAHAHACPLAVNTISYLLGPAMTHCSLLSICHQDDQSSWAAANELEGGDYPEYLCISVTWIFQLL